jgi:hypothetical protein
LAVLAPVDGCVVSQSNVLNESFRTSHPLNDSFRTTAGEAADLRPPKYPPGDRYCRGRAGVCPAGLAVPPSWPRFERPERLIRDVGGPQ